MDKKIILFLVFAIFQSKLLGQNTIFTVKTQYESLFYQGLYGFQHFVLMGGVTSSDSIVSKFDKQKIDFQNPKIFTKPKSEIFGKVYNSTEIFVMPGDTITFETYDSVVTKYPAEQLVLKKLSFYNFYSTSSSKSKNELQQNPVYEEEVLHKKIERLAILDSNKNQVRPIFYELMTKFISLKEKTGYHLLAATNKISKKIDLENADFISELKFINTIKPNEFDLYGEHLNVYFESLVEQLKENYSLDSLLEIKSKKINSRLNQYLSDLFMSKLVFQLARNQRLSMRFLYDFYDNCEEQKCIDRVFGAIPYGPMTSQDKELKATEFATLDGEKTTWQKLINSNNGKVVYYYLIEGNNKKCEEAIKKLKAFKIKNPDVIVNIITKADNDNQWLKIISDLQILSFGKHFRLHPETLLSRVLTEPDLPRGVLISKIGRIVSIHSNNPESELMQQNLIEANEF